MALERLTDYQNNGDFLSDDVNTDFDRVWAALQQNKNTLTSAIRPAVTDTVLDSSNTELAAPSVRADKVLAFDSTGELEYLSLAFAAGDYVIYNNVSTMTVDTSLTAGDWVGTQGYNTSGDDGKAIYKISATDDDGRDLQLSNGLYAIIQIEPVMNVKQFGVVANGTADDSSAFLGMILALADSGSTVRSSAGDIIHITESVSYSGFTLDLVADSDIKISGADASVYDGGAIIVGDNARLTGAGDIYTSGVLAISSGSHTVRQNGGVIDGKITVYSQLSYGVIHKRGDCAIKIIGGRGRAFGSYPENDEPLTLNIEYFNAGIQYTDKAVLTPIAVPSDSRAVGITPAVAITSLVKVTVNGSYSWKNAAWLGTDGFSMSNLIVDGYTSKAGYYLDETETEQDGHGAGTCWEIEDAPDVVFNGNSKTPKGYNLAIVSGSHRAVTHGEHIGEAGDPNVTIANSDDCIIGGTLRGGTVGVSVGEDGAQSDGTVIRARMIDITTEPVRVSAALNTRLSGAAIQGVLTSTTNGSWSGLGAVAPVVRVLREQYGANDIVIENTTISGPYTHDVIEKGDGSLGGDGGLRVVRSNNTYDCSILSHDEEENQNLLGIPNPGNTRAAPLSVIAATGGYADIGEIVITEASTLRYSYNLLSSLYNDLDALIASGDTLEDTLKNLEVVWYMQYSSSMPSDSSRLGKFGIGDNSGDVTRPFYCIFTAYETILGRPLKDGEYLPMRMPLYDLIKTGSDTGALTHFNVLLDNAPVGYDYRMTAPMVVEVAKYL
ncbi:MAG: hypothetical protein GY820_34680 [Gammaproteobacteria bacterium]|nr:hypothetical protein [Gammaproteobacteria bacterium]